MSGSRAIRIVAIFGPTAVGKSRVAVEVARAIAGEVVAADSMQIYRGLPILTDQPGEELMTAVFHHLVGVVPLSAEYSAARYAREAEGIVREVAGRRRLPLLAGGTGLYMRGLLGGLSFAPRAGSEARARWEGFLAERGADAAFRELKRLDPGAAAVTGRGNPRRLVRALEAAQARAESPELAANGTSSPAPVERGRLWSAESPYRVLSFGLEMPRAALYARIDQRVDEMMAAGAVDEVREALRGRVSRTAAQAIGFQDIRDYIEGAQTFEQAAAAMKQKSRRYAKRQLTWMRKMPDVVRIDVAGRTPEQAARQIIDCVRQAGFFPYGSS
ncbi:MAG: tRNA (adenosine(37)-N6)-dimethylallyltransferase MiaA [Thermoleophilia bacterium]|nr:tRNA (adenosine(37)-N6)-dimethylallyltransferase MiaA [Thermoleophilia bacterium]